MMMAYCDSTGVIRFNTAVPEGSIEIARGPTKALRELMALSARHGYKKGVLLVPGIPEAANQYEGIYALIAFCKWLAKTAPKGITVNMAKT